MIIGKVIESFWLKWPTTGTLEKFDLVTETRTNITSIIRYNLNYSNPKILKVSEFEKQFGVKLDSFIKDFKFLNTN